MKIKILNEFCYQSFPEVDGMVEVDEILLERIGIDKKFDIIGKTIIDYTQPEPTPTQKQQNYEQLVEQYIREKYTISQELAILRQRDTKPIEFEEYNAYAEECKQRARLIVYA